MSTADAILLSLTGHRKQTLSSQNAELKALEARLRETELQLKAKESAMYSIIDEDNRNTSSPHRRQPIGSTFNGHVSERLSRGHSQTSSMVPEVGSGPVMASTMSRWKPATQDAATDEQKNAHDIAAERLNGQQGNRVT